MASELSAEDEAFLATCEEEFKDRYTEKDIEFMKVFTAEPSDPPIIKIWPSKRRDRQYNRRYVPYTREGSHRNRGYWGGHDRGSFYNRGYSDYHQRDHNYNPNYNRFQRQD